LKNLDIWKEAGYNKALKKTITATAKNGKLSVWFPNVAAGEAIISAMAISTLTAQTIVSTVKPGGYNIQAV
jgi:beta-galactosidase